MPTARRAQRQVELAPLPGARKTAAETDISQGAGLAQAKQRSSIAMAGFGNTVAQVGIEVYSEIRQQERQRANDVALLGAQNELDAGQQLMLYGDGSDNNRGALSRRGKDALTLPEETSEQWQQLTSRIEAGLTTDEQKLAFAKIKSQAGQNVNATIRRHVFGAINEYEAAELKATLQNVTQNVATAALSPDAPKMIAEQLARGEAALRSSGKRQGLGPEAMPAAIDALRTDVHTTVINTLLAQDQTTKAKDYFDATKDQIKGDALPKVIKALEEGDTREQTQDALGKILAAGGTLEEQRKKARETLSGEVEDRVLQGLEHEHTVKKALERENVESLVNKGKAIIDRGGSPQSIPPAQWTALVDAGQGGVIREYWENKSKGIKVTTDPNVFYQLTTLATSPLKEDRQAFSQMNMPALVNKLSESDWQQFVGLQGRVRQGLNVDNDKLLVNATAQNQIIDDALRSMNLDPKPAEPGSKAYDQQATYRVGEFRRSVRDATSRLEQQTGKPATDEQVQSIVDQLRAPTGQRLLNPGGWWDKWAPAYAFETAQAQVKAVADVPPGERQKIESALRSRNLPVTDAAILNLFNIKLSETRKDR